MARWASTIPAVADSGWKGVGLAIAVLVLGTAIASPTGAARTSRPDILVIAGDGIGSWNIGAYHSGVFGNKMPNIDRVVNESAMFTNYYAEQSCTAGRSAFMIEQHPLRTGLSKLACPESVSGWRQRIQRLPISSTPGLRKRSARQESSRRRERGSA